MHVAYRRRPCVRSRPCGTSHKGPGALQYVLVGADVARVLRFHAVLTGVGAPLDLIQALADRRVRPGAYGKGAAFPRPLVVAHQLCPRHSPADKISSNACCRTRAKRLSGSRRPLGEQGPIDRARSYLLLTSGVAGKTDGGAGGDGSRARRSRRRRREAAGPAAKPSSVGRMADGSSAHRHVMWLPTRSVARARRCSVSIY